MTRGKICIGLTPQNQNKQRGKVVDRRRAVALRGDTSDTHANPAKRWPVRGDADIAPGCKRAGASKHLCLGLGSFLGGRFGPLWLLSTFIGVFLLLLFLLLLQVRVEL